MKMTKVIFLSLVCFWQLNLIADNSTIIDFSQKNPLVQRYDQANAVGFNDPKLRVQLPVVKTAVNKQTDQDSTPRANGNQSPRQMKQLKIVRTETGAIEVPNAILVPGSEIMYEYRESKTVVSKTIYVVEDDSTIGNSRTLKIAKKDSISWLGRELLTITVANQSTGLSNVPMITRTNVRKLYVYYESLKLTAAAAVACAGIAFLDWFGF